MAEHIYKLEDGSEITFDVLGYIPMRYGFLLNQYGAAMPHLVETKSDKSYFLKGNFEASYLSSFVSLWSRTVSIRFSLTDEAPEEAKRFRDWYQFASQSGDCVAVFNGYMLLHYDIVNEWTQAMMNSVAPRPVGPEELQPGADEVADEAFLEDDSNTSKPSTAKSGRKSKSTSNTSASLSA